jgi:cell division protein FtsB
MEDCVPLKELIAPLLARHGTIERAPLIAEYLELDVEVVKEAIRCAEALRDQRRAETVAALRETSRQLEERVRQLEAENENLRSQAQRLEKQRRPRGA